MAASFLDAQGREWSLKINVPLINDLRQLVGVDLLQKGDAFFQLADDVELFVDTLYVLCRQQCDEREMTSAQFGEALGGVDLENLSQAFIAAFHAYWPKRKRELDLKLKQMLHEHRTNTQKV